MAHTLHVVSHTHWDREWYLTFQQFRMRLVDLIDNVLALLDRDPDYRYFNLDAQTIVLEDYLAIKPQNRARLERYIRKGRITIGPWYQLNDEFLTSGEATVRSLLVGHRIARQFGACMKIGYLPDQFGNLSQMPQIFRGFGIDNAIVGRGYQLVDDRKMEFLWQSPDGSEVTASLMAFWYNNAQHFPADPEEALRYTLSLRDRMAPRSAVSHLLLMNGVDHLEAQQDLSPILAALRERLPDDTQIVHSTLPQYIEAVKQEVREKGITLEKHVGELREDRGGACLAGTLSSRMYLKQANHHAQITLEKYAEPFSSFALLTGGAYPYDFLHYAWKLLMQNHPHDSICGCSVDQVHREMLPRFQQVEQIGEEVIARSLRHVAERVALTPDPSPTLRERGESNTQDSPLSHSVGEGGRGGEGLVVFNSLNWARTDPVIATLTFPLGEPTRGNPPRNDSRQVHGFTLTDETGAEIPFAVTDVVVKMRQVLSPVELPLDQWVQEYTIEFVATDVPACGYKSYLITPRLSMPDYPAVTDRMLPNFTTYPLFEDCGDVGDEYLHRLPLNDALFRLQFSGTARHDEVNAIRQIQTSSTEWELPASATSTGHSRSESRVRCRIVTRLIRYRDIPRLELETTFDNRARDHRLRVCFDWIGLKPLAMQTISDAPFDTVARPCLDSQAADGASTFYPQQSWAAFTGNLAPEKVKTMTLISQGLPEYEAFLREGRIVQKIALTLLRCVGYLSRRGDGPQIETPEAQCLGVHRFRYAITADDGDWKEAKVWKQAHQFNVPLRAVQTTAKPGQSRDLPPSLSFVTVEPDTLVVTALKRAEDDPNTLIVRCFNITDEPVTQARVAARGAKSARLVNLNEEPQETLTLDSAGAVTLETVRPKQIVTLAFAL
ncbi:MAG TPA: glycosyl hydrolase-related protein [Chthonomonadaceae bacterium]|nr:glycosyl hydrolase-related protein [Chthonomonadaceae bacterium]